MVIEKKKLFAVAARLVCLHKGKGTCRSEGTGCKECGVDDPVNVVLDAYNLGREEKK